MANKQRPVKIKEGYYKIARMINRSEIWQTKPSWWFKVWTYLIGHVNHADNGVFHRGTNFVSLQMIWNDCFLINDGIKDCKTVHNVIRWLKINRQITTRKTTRGFHVTLCNYELYQNGLNYVNDIENDTKNDTGTILERYPNDTINNNVNNEEINTYAEQVRLVFEHFCTTMNKKIQLSPERGWIIEQRLKEGRTVEEMKEAIDNFSKDTWENRHQYCDLIYAIGTRNKVNNLDKWLNSKESKPKLLELG